MNPILSISMWVSLPIEVRRRIRNLFGIPRSSNTVVNDGVVETDGTTKEDFQHLTINKMQRFLQDESMDFHKLFDLTVAKINEDIINNRLTVFPTILEKNVKTKKGTKESK